MIKDMYRLNPALYSYRDIYIYGEDGMAGQLKKDLGKQGITAAGCLKDGGPQSLKDAAVILCGIDAETFRLLEKTGVRTVFTHRLLYQEEVLLDARQTGFAFQTLFLGVPELYERENIIFGAGEDGHRLFMETLNIGIYITAFCDSDPAYQGMRLLGKPIRSFGELCQNHKNSNILIGSRRYFGEITKQLSGCGFFRLYRWG